VQIGISSAAMLVRAANSAGEPVPSTRSPSHSLRNRQQRLWHERTRCELGVPGDGRLCAHPGGSGGRGTDLYRWGRNPDRDVERERGHGATDTLGATSLSFPATESGQVSATQTLSLINSGGLPLSSIVVSATGPFEVTSSCGTQLAADSACSLTVTFAPLSAGALSGTLTVTDALRTSRWPFRHRRCGGCAEHKPASLSFLAQTVATASAP